MSPTSARSNHAVTVELDVPFHDCDPLFVVWHGRYFEYMAQARTALMKSIALDVPDVRDMGYRMYMTDVRCRYMYPLGYGDRVAVTAWFVQAEPILRVAYTLENVTAGRKAARGYTEIATTDANGNLVTRLPDAIRSRLPV
jgi:acyl-CoA thioester hydrolase